MSTVEIRLDGSDVTDSVIFADAEFTQQANGQPGTARCRLRDPNHTLHPRAGQTLTVDVDGVRVWGGWALRVSPGWFFAVDDTSDPQETERVWVLEGVDYNILFSKRFLINKAHPTKMTPLYPAGTPDDQIVLDIVARFLELAGDGISTSGVTHVGTPNPDQAGNVGNPGESWGTSMTLISQPTQAVFYIDPRKILRFVDIETVTAPFALSDTPDSVDSFGYREMEIINDGTNLVNDSLVWGAGAHSTPDIRFKRVQDEDSIGAHGRWQRGEFTTALFTPSGVNDRARSFVYGSPQSKRGGKDDSIQVVCVTYRPGLTAGQIVSFTSTIFGYSDNLPIRRLGIRFPTKFDVEFRAFLSYDIDAPWSDYEFWFPKINYRIPPFVPPDFPPFPPLPPGPVFDDGCTCGITDDFQRDVDPGFGTATCGIEWITNSGTGYIFGVDGLGRAFGDTSTGLDGSVDLPLPIGAFTVVVRLSGYALDTALGWINLTSPGFDSSNYLYLDPSNSYVALNDSSTDDAASFSFNGDPIFVKIQRSDVGTLARIWDENVAEPGSWDWSSPVGFRVDQPAVSFQPDDNGLFNIVELHVFDDSFQELTSCGLMIDNFDRTDLTGWGTSTPGGQAWTNTGGGGSTYTVEDGVGKIVFDQDTNDEETLDYVPTLPLDITFLGTKISSTNTTAMPLTPPNVVAYEFTDFAAGLEIDISQRGLVQCLLASFVGSFDFARNLADTDGVNVRVVSSDGKSDVKVWAWMVGDTMPVNPQINETGIGGTRDLTTLKVFTGVGGFSTQVITVTVDGIGLDSTTPECAGCGDTDSFNRSDTVLGLGLSDAGVEWEQGGYISGNEAEAPAVLKGESRLPVATATPFSTSIIRTTPSDPDIDGVDPRGRITILTSNGSIVVTWREVLSGSDWTLTELDLFASADDVNGFDESLVAEVYTLTFPFTVEVSFVGGIATAAVDGHTVTIDYTAGGMTWPVALTGYQIGQNE